MKNNNDEPRTCTIPLKEFEDLKTEIQTLTEEKFELMESFAIEKDIFRFKIHNSEDSVISTLQKSLDNVRKQLKFEKEKTIRKRLIERINLFIQS